MNLKTTLSAAAVLLSPVFVSEAHASPFVINEDTTLELFGDEFNTTFKSDIFPEELRDQFAFFGTFTVNTDNLESLTVVFNTDGIPFNVLGDDPNVVISENLDRDFVGAQIPFDIDINPLVENNNFIEVAGDLLSINISPSSDLGVIALGFEFLFEENQAHIIADYNEVPLPGAALLLVTGLAGAGALSRRKRDNDGLEHNM